MGSGTFPIKNGAGFCKIKAAIKLIEEIRNEWTESVFSGDSGGNQLDNAAIDGGYLERMSIAIDMLEGCLHSEGCRKIC